MELSGKSIIGMGTGGDSGELMHATNPKTGRRMEPEFHAATADEVEKAVNLAHQAFEKFSRASGLEKSRFLRKIAANIEANAPQIIERAELETALPEKRLQSEIARTCGQLRLFARLVEDGSWVMARLDRPDPNRTPIPKPDLRSMLRPLGPVVVFGASNFPLAFSVAGGDTASALAAGNPVIVKAHSAHPGTSELVGHAIRNAVRECNMPEGIFSLLFGGGNQVGIALMKHPLVKAAGFTGSRSAGRILLDVAAARRQPIPFYAEMSSTNPVFILPGALRERADTIADDLYASFTLGAGQFCTKPGMIFLPRGKAASGFTRRLERLVLESSPFQLLTDVIRTSYRTGTASRKESHSVKVVAEKVPGADIIGFSAGSALFETDAESFLANPVLAEEIFGPTTLLIQHSNREQVLQIARGLEGHLTATIQGNEQDLHDFSDLLAILEDKVGRLVFNHFPTGVEVSHAMVHGGPYPATSDGRSTSVGSQAIFRFARPVCYQGFPDIALPLELRVSNPLGIWRMVDGEMTREAISGAQTSATKDTSSVR